MVDWYRVACERQKKLDEANAMIRELRALLRPNAHFPAEWGLTPAQARILALVALTGEAKREALQVAGAKDPSEPSEIAVLKTQVSNIRRRLKPFGVRIGTAWGVGYYLNEKSRALVKAALRVAE